MSRCSNLLGPLGLLLAASLVAVAAPPTAPEPITDCGIEPAVIPDFTLVDQNPRSATYGVEVGRQDLLGQVLVVYWAQAT